MPFEMPSCAAPLPRRGPDMPTRTAPGRFVNRVTFFIADVVRLHGVGGLILLEQQTAEAMVGALTKTASLDIDDSGFKC